MNWRELRVSSLCRLTFLCYATSQFIAGKSQLKAFLDATKPQLEPAGYNRCFRVPSPLIRTRSNRADVINSRRNRDYPLFNHRLPRSLGVEPLYPVAHFIKHSFPFISLVCFLTPRFINRARLFCVSRACYFSLDRDHVDAYTCVVDSCSWLSITSFVVLSGGMCSHGK